MRNRILTAAALAFPMLAMPVAAHQPEDQPEGSVALHVEQHEKHGNYLVDQAGMALYLFEADQQGGEGSEPRSNCHEDCATAWPPLVTDGEPQVHDELDAELLGTIKRDGGETQVTYNGWPLYYYSADAAPGHTRGHHIESHGGEWYLVTPEGGEAGEEH
jgi:predicted lipoprotein with Yx(FWY)xxD motif